MGGIFIFLFIAAFNAVKRLWDNFLLLFTL